MVATLIEAFGNWQSPSQSPTQSQSECRIFAPDNDCIDASIVQYCGNYMGQCDLFSINSEAGNSFLKGSKRTCNPDEVTGTMPIYTTDEATPMGWMLTKGCCD